MIPGLIGNKMSTKSIDIKPCGKEDLVINRIVIDTTPNFEDKFLTFLEHFVYEKYKMKDELEPKATLLRIGEPRIKERKI